MTKRQKHRLWRLKVKDRAMKKYGNSCAGCGETELVVLSIDHINGDGAQKRRAGELKGWAFYSRLMRTPKRNDLRVLCMNCQYRKRVYGEACI